MTLRLIEGMVVGVESSAGGSVAVLASALSAFARGNPTYQAWFCDFMSPVQAPGSPTYGVILIWGFFYDKDMSLGFKFIKYLKKLQSESIFKLDFSEKKSKILPDI